MSRSYASPKERADDALLSMVPPKDYETWKNIGISYKAAGGDLDTFLSWSGSDPENYDESQARKLFENVAEDGKITAGTLFWHAYRNGWVGGFAGDGTSWKPKKDDDAPKPLDLEPVQQAITQLKALFEPGEYVNVSVKAKWIEKRQKWEPADGGTCYELDELIELLKDEDFGGVLDGFEPEAGVWLCQNPTNGEGRGKNRTVRWRHALIESDDLPVADQIRIMRELDLPITTLTMSGGKSVHALVRIDADGPNHYDERVQLLHELCNEAGLKVDPANKDSSRLTRFAGIRRRDQRQTLLYTGIGAKDFHTWAEAHRHKPEEGEDEQDAIQKFESLFRPMPAERQELPPVLIENTFRKEGVMLIGAAPKVGKTFLAAQMTVGFATGTSVLGFAFTQCERILVVNSEMSQAEYDNRVIDAALSPETAAEVAKHVRIAHTDDSPELTVEGIAKIICDSGYKPDVVIIDPIYPLFVGDENSNADAKTTLGYLKMIASRTGAGVIYMHHFSKGPQDLKEARDRVSGAGTLGRNYSAMWSLTELAPSEEDMAGFPDGSVVVRVSIDLRSFKKSKGNKNLDFNAVRMNGMFFRDDDGKFDKTPTREAARRAEANKKTAQKEKRMEKVRKKIKELLDKNDGEPVLFSTVENLTATSANTIKDYLIDMDEYQLVKMQVDGKGQKRNHIAWAAWQAPLGAELVTEDGDGDE